MTDFATPVPPELSVELGRGRVRVDATGTSTTEVHVEGPGAPDTAVEHLPGPDGGTVVVRGPRGDGMFGRDRSVDVHVVLPEGSRVTARLGSADLTTSGELGRCGLKAGSGDVRATHLGHHSGVQTGSGDITVERAGGDLRLQTGSGDVRLGEADGTVSISTGSGDVHVEQAGPELVVKTGSGDLEVGRSTDHTAFSTGSGDLVVRRAERGRITTKGASGEVSVRVPDGLPVWTDLTTLSGRVTSTLTSAGEPAPGQDHLEVRSTTASGDITLSPA